MSVQTNKPLMRGPVAKSAGSVIVNAIAKHGPMTIEQGIAIHGRLHSYVCKHRAIYERAVLAGWLNEHNGAYSLTPAMKALLTKEKPVEKASAAKPDAVVAPAYLPPFRPLKALPMPIIRADAQPLRDMTFHNGSVGFMPGHYA